MVRPGNDKNICAYVSEIYRELSCARFEPQPFEQAIGKQ